MSSLPTSDGFNHPAISSGQSPETGNPTSLARSVSASVCPIKPSDPDSIKPKAVKALKASGEFHVNSKKKEHLPLQDLSDHASSADQSPAMPLPTSSEDAAVADGLEKPVERSTQGLKFFLHTRQEANLSVTATRMHESQVVVSKKGWHPESQNPGQVDDLPQDKESENRQLGEVRQDASPDQEHICDKGDLEHPEERQQDHQKIVDLEAALKGAELQQNVDLLSTKRSFPPSGCFDCSNSEMLMEIDTVEQSLVAVLSSAGSQNASAKSIGACGLTSDNPLMEIETSKCNPSSASLNNSTSAQDFQPPESNVEMSETNKKYGNYPPSLSVCGSCQPSSESTEESCSSITAALKELHELLVISSKPASESISEEVICQSEKAAEGQTGFKDLSEKRTQSEHLTHSEQCPQVFSQARSVSVKTESLVTVSGTGIEDVENSSFGGSGHGLSIDEESVSVSQSRNSASESSSVTMASANSSDQLRCTLAVEISAELVASEEDALNQTSEQTKSLPSSFILVKDLGQGIQDPVTDRPETRENVCSEATRPFLELEQLTSHPLPSPSILPPLVFPATDIDRILRAGFTLQEALGALHQVGGNADLALLVLLAKNIVVPT